MRLICPNCGAQYEVPNEVIPESGRDVQCSNCGDTWFQHHPDHEPLEGSDNPEAGDESWENPAESGAEPEDASGDHPRNSDDEQTEEAPDDQADEMTPRPLDSSVTDVLREEAQREQAVREAEARGGLETQPDLGLDDQSDSADERSRQARTRMSRLRGESETEVVVASAIKDDIEIGSRRNLLPDIEEINSSLNTSPARGAAAQTSAESKAESAGADRSGSFRRGFMVAVLLVLILLLLYKFAPMISARIPATEGPLAAYVEAINTGRAMLADKVSGLLGQ